MMGMSTDEEHSDEELEKPVVLAPELQKLLSEYTPIPYMRQ